MAELLLSEGLEPGMSICYKEGGECSVLSGQKSYIHLKSSREGQRKRQTIGEGIPGKEEDMSKDSEGSGAEVNLSKS